MKPSVLFTVLVLVIIAAGCGSGNNNAPSTPKDVTAFKGNPKDPSVQKALQEHFGRMTPPAPPANASAAGQ